MNPINWEKALDNPEKGVSNDGKTRNGKDCNSEVDSEQINGTFATQEPEHNNVTQPTEADNAQMAIGGDDITAENVELKPAINGKVESDDDKTIDTVQSEAQHHLVSERKQAINGKVDANSDDKEVQEQGIVVEKDNNLKVEIKSKETDEEKSDSEESDDTESD